MNETLPLLLSVCALLVVIGGLIIVGGFLVLRFFTRGVGGLPLGILGGLIGAVREVLGGDEEVEEDEPLPRRHREPPPPQVLDLDFEAAVARHAQDKTPPPNPDDPATAQGANIHLPNIQSPVMGRTMRDGRYRRVTGGTPGREKDEDFRRAGDTPLPDFDLGAPPERPLRQRRRKRRDHNEDELFGGMLDEDGDGDLDF